MIDYFGADLQLKTVSLEQRLISGYAAVHHSVDRVKDIIDPSASVKAVGRLGAPSDVAVFIGHRADSLPIGIPQKIEATNQGLYTETYILKGPAGDNLLAVAKDLMAHDQSLGMSIGYKTRDSRREQAGNKMVRRLMDYELKEFSYASAQAIAHPQALVSAVKARRAAAAATDQDTDQDTDHDPEQEHDAMPPEHDDDDQRRADGAGGRGGKTAAPLPESLPNSSYLYLEDGADDDDGKRVPRSKRHLPYRDAAGALDVPQLKAAIAHLGPETALPGLDGAAQARLAARARRLLVQAESGKTYAPAEEWTTGAPLAIYGLGIRLLDLAEQLHEEHKAMALLTEETKDGQRIRPAMREHLGAVGQDLSDLLGWAATLERGEDGQQRLAWFKAQLALTEV